MPRAGKPSLVALPDEYLQTRMEPRQTRDGYPVRKGKGVMAGPADTYTGYGRGWATVSNTPFREYKHWVHEGGISTPLIVHWPDKVERKGELETAPGHVVDLMATAIDVASADYPTSYHENRDIIPMEGQSLVPAFLGQKIEREAIYWEHEGNRAIRVGDYKLVAKGADGPGSCTTLLRTARNRMTSVRGSPVVQSSWPRCGKCTRNEHMYFH